MDAILAYDDQGRPIEPAWPEAEIIIGNPPFLGDKKMRSQLDHKYVDDLRTLYSARIPGQSDLVCYWFEKARALLEIGRLKRAGMLATQGIRGGANRRALERIKESGDIFWAQSDRDWILDGAHVHVSMIGFDDGTELHRLLDDRL
jgi:type II restriction/modification system DNA methylase subunit YeeA